jgi:prolipoprotein diacylglyceryltransferase
VPPVVTLSFDPVVRLTDTASVRWETIGLAVVLFVGLLIAARLRSASPEPDLRLDDLVFLVVGAVPGAILGGRTGYVLDHLDFYRANPTAILDPAQGALTLTLAVPFGILTAGIVARLLGAPIGRWMHAITLPVLFVLAAGKLVGVLGGSGQGARFGGPGALAYLGPGPWGSLAADVPSYPSQVYEAIAIGLIVVVLAVVGRAGFMRRANGAALFLALGLWAAARFAVAFTWRDALAVGPLRTEQALLAGVLVIAAVGLVQRVLSRGDVPAQGAIEPSIEIDAEANPA